MRALRCCLALVYYYAKPYLIAYYQFSSLFASESSDTP